MENQKTKIVAIVGMEHFNHAVWRKVQNDLGDCAELNRYTDVELERHDAALAERIQDADCLFLSMIHHRDAAEFLQEQMKRSKAKTVFAFESMPEVMALNKVGDYAPASSGKKAGMPAPVKKVAMLLVKGREEDALYGYTKLMKVMQAMMRFMPEKMRDFKNWMTVNVYWNQPAQENITSMFRLILREYFGAKQAVPAAVEMPMMGVYHPDAPAFFKDIKSYEAWSKRKAKAREARPRIGLLFFRKHLAQERSYIDDTIRAFEAAGQEVVPVFVAGVEGHVAVRDWLSKEHIDALVSMIGFAFVGGPAGSTKPGLSKQVAEEVLGGLDVPYIVAQPLFAQDFNSWREHGAGPMQSTVLYALPEMDGAIAPVVIGALKDGKFQTAADRLARLTQLSGRWAGLRRKSNADKKVAFVLYDYPPGMGKKGTAALLDVPRSLLNILRRMQSQGYHVGQLPDSPEALMALIDASTDPERAQPGAALTVSETQYKSYTTPRERERIEARWGAFPGEVAPVGRDGVFAGGVTLGNIYIGVQPRMAVQGDPMRLLFDKENTPHHQYIAFYRHLSRGFGADALVHVGMHGSAEWMPGLQLGLSAECWSDALLGELPHLYVYPMNNPSEANIAKRRGYAAMVSHNVPPLMRAGLYKELLAVKEMLGDWREREAGAIDEEAIMKRVALANLDTDCPRAAGETFKAYANRLYAYLRDLDQRLINGSLHVFGEAAPIDSQITLVTETLKARESGHALTHIAAGEPVDYAELGARARHGDAAAMAQREQIDERCREFVAREVFGPPPHSHASQHVYNGHSEQAAVLAAEGRKLAQMLASNSVELDALLHGLQGGYILPHPGGDLIRDGANVLPTGRNIHAIDPWRIPSELAYRRGAQIAEAILRKHVDESGAYPETVAQVLWGMDTIKTKGEAVGSVLAFIGARPAYDGQGKISHYELIPLGELGRPRVDVLMNLSPIFRDTFAIVMDHLDKLVQAAAKADEPHELNFVRKHVDEAMRGGTGFADATARMFTQQPGQYGTYVDDMIDDSAWQTSDDLDATFIRRNAFAYGGERHGAPAGPMLQKLLGTVGRVVQEVDSVEFGVSDIDHYFSSSGALQLAARKRAGAHVRLNYVETYTAETRIDDVDSVLRMEYRTKLLNPRWYEGMLQHGRSGAAEISNRFTYMLGWDAVGDCVDDWVYGDAAKTFALDATMRERLAQHNPQAMRNIVGRLLEANGRGLWQADDDTIHQLKEVYANLEDRLEGVAA